MKITWVLMTMISLAFGSDLMSETIKGYLQNDVFTQTKRIQANSSLYGNSVYGFSVYGFSVYGYSVYGYYVYGYSALGYYVCGYSIYGYSVYTFTIPSEHIY